MKCNIYRMENQKNKYIILVFPNQPQDVFDANELAKIGNWVFYKTKKFESDSPLIAADPRIVIKNIEKNKFHIQETKVESKISNKNPFWQIRNIK